MSRTYRKSVADLHAPQHAAVDRDVGASDEVRRRTGKECSDAGEIVRRAKPAGRGTAKGSFVQGRHGLQALGHVGVDVARQDGVLTWMLSFAQADAQFLLS